jgi:hypothetical protein
MPDDSPSEPIVNTMPDADKPEESKPIRFVFPRGITAEEADRRVKELVDKHNQADKPAEFDGGETRK